MKVDLSHIRPNLSLEIEGDENTLFEISDEEVIQFGEAKIQLVEGCFYEYQFSDNTLKFKEDCKSNKIISFSKFSKFKGTINPNIYVGTHSLELDGIDIFFPIEVRSIKSEYREDYRYMLESITEKCTDLIMQIDSPISQHFETDFDESPKTLYQRFCFVKALIDSKEFEEAIQKIASNPSTKWEAEHEEKDIRSIRRFTQKNIKQLASKHNRTGLSKENFLYTSYSLSSIPRKIDSTRKKESVDTAENRFIKHALEEFLFFCENCETKFQNYSRAKLESNILSSKISNLLNQSFFKEISRPYSLRLNSPILQRKSGYREVLNAWLKFDLAAKLIWNGGDDVYEAGKKDIASLYEYWLFFALLDILKGIFDIEPKSIRELIQFDKGKLSLNLKKGSAIALKGVYHSAFRNLNIQFSYNRAFGGGKKYPHSGSYTTTLRPDYTLSIWPEEIRDPKEGENKELITHIHFDAKYKVNNFYELISKSEGDSLTENDQETLLKDEEEESKSGNFKNQDLLKMHAYKDAIRRTGGAYVLYPGEGKDDPFRGFHELIPGLGAFVIKPNESDTDKEHLILFIKKVVQNFLDRSSQRENTAVKTYDIHKESKLDGDALNELMPEYVGDVKLIPSETFVLVGYCSDLSNIEWYKKEGKYIFRMDDERGSLVLDSSVVNAKYLLLREKGNYRASKIFRIKSIGPKVFKGESLIGYKTKNLKDYYLVIEIEKEESLDFGEVAFDFHALEKYKEILTKYNAYTAVGLPFSVTLRELMRVKVKE